jgi:DNA-binding Lrp family transcriptional regulator
MAEKTLWESVKVEGEELLERVKDLVREGNVRRIVIQHQGKSVAEFPLTVGVVGALAAPALAAIGALAAVLTECTIQIERTESTPLSKPATAPPRRPRPAAKKTRR